MPPATAVGGPVAIGGGGGGDEEYDASLLLGVTPLPFLITTEAAATAARGRGAILPFPPLLLLSGATREGKGEGPRRRRVLIPLLLDGVGGRWGEGPPLLVAGEEPLPHPQVGLGEQRLCVCFKFVVCGMGLGSVYRRMWGPRFDPTKIHDMYIYTYTHTSLPFPSCASNRRANAPISRSARACCPAAQ